MTRTVSVCGLLAMGLAGACGEGGGTAIGAEAVEAGAAATAGSDGGAVGTAAESAATGGSARGGRPADGGSTGGAATGGASGAETTGGSASTETEDCRAQDGRTTIAFVNHCARMVTVEAHVGDSDLEPMDVPPGDARCQDLAGAQENIGGRAWGYYTELGDPGPERHTLAEFNFNDTSFYDMDWYNISHVDAHNLPMAFLPVGRPDCPQPSCPDELLSDCPDVGRVYGDTGDVVSCYSPNRDDGQSEVALYFEQCDDAYAWSADDQNGDDPSPMKACRDGGEDFEVMFCPRG